MRKQFLFCLLTVLLATGGGYIATIYSGYKFYLLFIPVAAVTKVSKYCVSQVVT